MEHVAVDGSRLSSLLLGRGGGTPLVMLHGLVHGNMASWYFSAAPALAAQRRVVLYDQRGHGGSPLATGRESAGFDLESQVADLCAVLAHHGLADTAVDLAGHSIGALVALRFALRRPEQVRRLVLVDAPMPARDHAGPSLLDLPPLEEPAAAAPAGRRESLRRQRLAALLGASTLVADVLAMGPEPESELAGLRRPVLLLYGRRSPCVSAGAWLQARLPQAQLELLDCGHYVLEEAPAELRAALLRFLADA